jgi:2-C-methyl-D-erythritol 4-phosphate cytidylyltransferase/2-C-methyl-D-erythritol 2,4-cyclodiphosphate synthase
VHFPPSDQKWKNANSAIFVTEAMNLLRAANGTVANIDLTLLAESPKIGPYREAMRANIAKMLAISPANVNIKATTTEKLGFIGREEGIAAHAVATVLYPL